MSSSPRFLPSLLNSSLQRNLRTNLCSAVRMQALSRDEATIWSRQEHKASSDLARLTRSSHWRGELLLCLLGHCSWDEWCPNRAWTDTIDSNALLKLLVWESTSKSYDGTFGGSVIEEVGTADIRIDRCASDDCVAALHVRKNVFGEVEEWVNIGIESVHPLLSIFSLVFIFLDTVWGKKLTRLTHRSSPS